MGKNETLTINKSRTLNIHKNQHITINGLQNETIKLASMQTIGLGHIQNIGSTKSSILEVLLLAISALPSTIRWMQSEPVNEAHTRQATAQGGELRDSQGGELRDGQPLKPGEIRDR